MFSAIKFKYCDKRTVVERKFILGEPPFGKNKSYFVYFGPRSVPDFINPKYLERFEEGETAEAICKAYILITGTAEECLSFLHLKRQTAAPSKYLSDKGDSDNELEILRKKMRKTEAKEIKQLKKSAQRTNKSGLVNKLYEKMDGENEENMENELPDIPPTPGKNIDMQTLEIIEGMLKFVGNIHLINFWCS
jgi:hypothetical protein